MRIPAFLVFLAVLAAAPGALASETRTSELEDTTYLDVGALCRGYVAWARASLPQRIDQMHAPLPTRTPRCIAERSPVPFQPSGPWRGLHVVHVDDGVVTSKRLVVQTAHGFSLAAIWWDTVDPFDPGCPSIIREIGIDAVFVQQGSLVVIMAGERTTYIENPVDPDPGYRAELVRVAFWAKDGGGAVKFASQDFGDRIWLGGKVQPHWEAKRWVAWEQLPWQGFAPFLLDPTGEPIAQEATTPG